MYFLKNLRSRQSCPRTMTSPFTFCRWENFRLIAPKSPTTNLTSYKSFCVHFHVELAFTKARYCLHWTSRFRGFQKFRTVWVLRRTPRDWATNYATNSDSLKKVSPNPRCLHTWGSVGYLKVSKTSTRASAQNWSGWLAGSAGSHFFCLRVPIPHSGTPASEHRWRSILITHLCSKHLSRTRSQKKRWPPHFCSGV